METNQWLDSIDQSDVDNFNHHNRYCLKQLMQIKFNYEKFIIC